MKPESWDKDELVLLSEECMWITLRRLLKLEEVEGNREPGLTWLRTPRRSDGYNSVFNVNLSPDRIDAELDRITENFDPGGSTPAGGWVLRPNPRTSSLRGSRPGGSDWMRPSPAWLWT